MSDLRELFDLVGGGLISLLILGSAMLFVSAIVDNFLEDERSRPEDDE